ncbi:MAG: hypothetical protein LBM95_03605 [Lactobacillales bacterium]|nr:hypothetical protein [Lactobacillales bacterium]
MAKSVSRLINNSFSSVQGTIAFLVILLLIAILVYTLISAFLIPGMVAYNKLTEKDTMVGEKDYLLGKLTLGIPDTTSTGEVLISGGGFSKTNKPARLYQLEDKPPDGIKQGETVLIIEVREGIAYVVKYERAAL